MNEQYKIDTNRFRTKRAQELIKNKINTTRKRRATIPEYKSAPEKQPLPELTRELTPNQITINEYKKFIEDNPTLLPKTTVFNEIDNIYKKEILDNPNFNNQDPEVAREAKNNDRDKAMYSFFSNADKIDTYFKQEIITEPLDIILKNNPDSNLYVFSTKVLWYSLSSCFKHGELDISVIKDKTGNDLHRSDTIVNGQELEREIYSAKLDNYERTDYLNLTLMDFIDKAKLTISLNTINLIDILRIQNLIQVPIDSVITFLSSKGINLGGFSGVKSKMLKYKLILNSDEQYIECNFNSPFINIDENGEIIVDGMFRCWFKANLLDLSYSFKVFINPPKQSQPILKQSLQPQESQLEKSEQSESAIQEYTNKISNLGKGAINYAKDNPATVATGVGAAAILGSTAGMLVLAGVLGGKTKKRSRLHKKLKNKKTIRKNKHKKTKKLK
jgi:hypothetical protein